AQGKLRRDRSRAEPGAAGRPPPPAIWAAPAKTPRAESGGLRWVGQGPAHPGGQHKPDPPLYPPAVLQPERSRPPPSLDHRRAGERRSVPSERHRRAVRERAPGGSRVGEDRAVVAFHAKSARDDPRGPAHPARAPRHPVTAQRSAAIVKLSSTAQPRWANSFFARGDMRPESHAIFLAALRSSRCAVRPMRSVHAM